ncbi:hypothetical protein TB1_029379 [Malus domestica]
MVEGSVFLDFGTDLGSSHHVPINSLFWHQQPRFMNATRPKKLKISHFFRLHILFSSHRAMRQHVYPMAFVTDRVLASAECSSYSYPSCSSPQFSYQVRVREKSNKQVWMQLRWTRIEQSHARKEGKHTESKREEFKFQV